MISNIEYDETLEINKMLKKSNSICTNKTLKEILDHLSDSSSLALKIVENNKIVGVWFSKEFEEYTSLSFFYIDESIRRKPEVIIFFKHCYSLTNIEKPLLIKSKDITGFERYVKKIKDCNDGNIYQFIGLR